MYLEIINPDNLDLDNFSTYLCAKLSVYSKDEGWFIPELSILWDEYFQELYKEADTRPTVKDIFQAYFSNLVYIKDKKNYIIKVDKNAKIEGIDATIESLAKIVNFGTLDMPRYNIFDRLFDFTALRLPSLYEEWSNN